MAAIRQFDYTINENSISPQTIAKGGVQGEHNATQINFCMTTGLQEKLKVNGNSLYYRFDGWDGAGVLYQFDPEEFNPQNKRIFSFLVDNKLTRCGGIVEIKLIITVPDETRGQTETEIITYSVKLALKSKSQSDEITGSDFNSVSTLAQIAKENAKIAEESSAKALEAQNKTENAKAILENDMEWVFDGGGASSEIDIEYVVDSELNASSENPVKNKAIYTAIEKLKKDLVLYGECESEVPEDTAGTFLTPIWSCKTNGNNIKECYTAFEYNIKEFTRYSLSDGKTVDVVYLGKICFPTGFFDSIPYVNISVGQNEQSGISFGGAWFTVTREKPSTDHTNNVYLITFADLWTNSANITEKNSGSGYAKYAMNNGYYIPCHISVDVKNAPTQRLDNAPLEPEIVTSQESNGNGGS